MQLNKRLHNGSKKEKQTQQSLDDTGEESRSSATYHFIHAKTLSQLRDGKKLHEKIPPELRQHVWFVENRMPPHSK